MRGLIAQRPPNAASGEVVGDVATIKGLEWIFENILVTLLGFAGIALFIMLILGGIRYITSAGDPKAAEGARNTLTYAIGGLVLIGLSYLILRLISDFTGIDVTIFRTFQ